MSAELLKDILDNWGGQQVYIKKSDWALGKLLERDLKMYEKFNGRNYAILAKEYDLTVQRVYEIIKSVHKAEINRRQSQLFPDGATSQ